MDLSIRTQLGATQRSAPPLGGWLPAIEFNDQQVAVLNAIADELIPGGDGFPAPSAVDIVGFFARYVAPSGQEPKWYPFLAEDDFRIRLDSLCDQLLNQASEQRVTVLRKLETEDEEFFTRVRDVVYYGYYSRPEVIRAINNNLVAGKDYRYSPQPFGYSDAMRDWDDDLLSRVKGTYIRTRDVRPIDVPEDFPFQRTVRQSSADMHTAQPAPTPSGA